MSSQKPFFISYVCIWRTVTHWHLLCILLYLSVEIPLREHLVVRISLLVRSQQSFLLWHEKRWGEESLQGWQCGDVHLGGEDVDAKEVVGVLEAKEEIQLAPKMAQKN